jgi:truncated hemoglobin YjbI
MRHATFHIDKKARDAWIIAMTSALGSVRSELAQDQYDELLAYFDMTAHQMRNV